MLREAPKQFSVLIVDDSTSARALLAKIVETDPLLSVRASVGTVKSAVALMKEALPDVLLLDLDLPEISGLSFLRKIMEQRPLPVVVCSAHVGKGSELKELAFQAGAFDVIEKPSNRSPEDAERSRRKICSALRNAATSPVRKPGASSAPESRPKLPADTILPMPQSPRPIPVTEPVVFIGASTGGTDALRSVLTSLPADSPPIVIVQHMPGNFTGVFAERLSEQCAIDVAEATDGMTLRRGLAIVAPGDRHILVRRFAQVYRCTLADGPHISRHRPSVDLLFRSAAISAGANALGVIMTGMGDDGAECLGDIKRQGGMTVAQDEQSCVVFGMPKEAILKGNVMKIVPLGRIADAITGFDRRHRHEHSLGV